MVIFNSYVKLPEGSREMINEHDCFNNGFFMDLRQLTINAASGWALWSHLQGLEAVPVMALTLGNCCKIFWNIMTSGNFLYSCSLDCRSTLGYLDIYIYINNIYIYVYFCHTAWRGSKAAAAGRSWILTTEGLGSLHLTSVRSLVRWWCHNYGRPSWTDVL